MMTAAVWIAACIGRLVSSKQRLRIFALTDVVEVPIIVAMSAALGIKNTLSGQDWVFD